MARIKARFTESEIGDRCVVGVNLVGSSWTTSVEQDGVDKIV